jgi:hypothetical protein
LKELDPHTLREGGKFVTKTRVIATLLAATAVMTLASPSTASAKDICLSEANEAELVFSKVKALKPGGAVALTGTWIFNGNSWPMSGSAIMRTNGAVLIQVFVGTAGANDMGQRVQWVGDSSFAGEADYDSDGDNTPDGALTLTALDCETVVFP